MIWRKGNGGAPSTQMKEATAQSVRTMNDAARMRTQISQETGRVPDWAIAHVPKGKPIIAPPSKPEMKLNIKKPI